MRALFLALFLAGPLLGFDFSLDLRGPATATAGYPFYLQIEAKVTEGQRSDWVAFQFQCPFACTLTGPGTQPSWGNRIYDFRNVLLRVDVPADAAPGSAVFGLSASSAGVSKSVAPFAITVVRAAPVTPVAMIAGPRPAKESQWASRMKQYGAVEGNPDRIKTTGPSWEGGVWFYDGARVFQQIQDYTGEDWSASIRAAADVYGQWVTTSNGRISGWRVFPHGVYRDGVHKQAGLLMAKNSSYAGSAGGVGPALSRETAYLLHAYRFARLMGEPHPLESQAVAIALGHLDQWFNPQARYANEPYFVQPFMAGLTMEALIQAYDESPDPRIPPAVKLALDALWDRHWVAADQAFDYASNDTNFQGAPDLNLLIAPAYAWYYALTGDKTYRDRGEMIFAGGVDRGYLGSGKHFSQAYRWSFDYVRWASLQPVPAEPTPEPVPDAVSRADLDAIVARFTAELMAIEAQLSALDEAIKAIADQSLTLEKLREKLR